MLASSAARLPEGDQWSYEVKWDGYRTLAVKDGARVTLLSRNLKDATAQYPRVARAVEQIRETSAMLDGEIVAIDEHGRPSFQALHHQAAHTAVFYASTVRPSRRRHFKRAPKAVLMPPSQRGDAAAEFMNEFTRVTVARSHPRRHARSALT